MMSISNDAFDTGDVYIDYSFERARFRYDKPARKVYLRFYGEGEDEVPMSTNC